MIITITNIKDMPYDHARAIDGIKTEEKAQEYAKQFPNDLRLYWLKASGLVFRPEVKNG